MTFRDDNGNVLETQDDVAITKQSISLFNFQIKGDFSVNFTVSNTNDNRKKLGYYGPTMVNQVAFTRQPWTLLRNGNAFVRGYIAIQDDDTNDLSCFFISGNSNWINLLGGFITELDYSDYQVQIANLSNFKSLNSGIVFPVHDWLYNLNKSSKFFVLDNLLDGNNNTFNEIMPCFYLKSLVQEIFEQSEIKFNGTLFNDFLYNSLLVGPITANIKRQPVNNVTAIGSNQAYASAPNYVKYTSLTAQIDPESTISSGSYIAPRSSVITYKIDINSRSVGTSPTIKIQKNGVDQGSKDVTTSSYYELSFPVYKGDIVDILVKSNTSAGSWNVDLTVSTNTNIGYLDYVTPNSFLPKYKSIDIVNFIVNFFGCSVYFDDVGKVISINIIENFKREDSYDWSNYYLAHSVRYTIENAKHNYVLFGDSDDSTIQSYNLNNEIDFANGDIQTGNEFKFSKDLFKIPFSPSYFGQEKSGAWMSSFPLISFQDSGTSITFTDIASSGGLASYNVGSTNSFTVGEVYRIVEDDKDVGYASVRSKTSDRVVFYRNWPGDTTGTLYKQTATFNSKGPALLVNNPNINVSNFQTGVFATYENTTQTTHTTYPYAYFAKSRTMMNLDSFKASASFGSINDPLFKDRPIQELYFNKISRLIGNPYFKVMMLLPEPVYKNFMFDRLIYLKTETLIGYFFIDKIVNYVNGSTPVEVDVYML